MMHRLGIVPQRLLPNRSGLGQSSPRIRQWRKQAGLGYNNCQINFEDNLSSQSFRSAIAIKRKIKIGAWKNPPRNALAGGREPCIFSGLGMAWKTVRSKFY